MSAVLRPRSWTFNDSVFGSRSNTSPTAPYLEILNQYEDTDSFANGRNFDSISAIKYELYADAALDEISEYMAFSNGWNGYNAVAFDVDVISRSQHVVRVIKEWLIQEKLEPVEIIPGPAGDGSVDIEFHLKRNHVILTIFPRSNDVNFYMEFSTKQDYEEMFEYSDAKLANMLSEAIDETA